jgi:hypothetical protein
LADCHNGQRWKNFDCNGNQHESRTKNGCEQSQQGIIDWAGIGFCHDLIPVTLI